MRRDRVGGEGGGLWLSFEGGVATRRAPGLIEVQQLNAEEAIVVKVLFFSRSEDVVRRRCRLSSRYKASARRVPPNRSIH